METKNRSASLTLWANRALMVIIAVLACSDRKSTRLNSSHAT